jgi:hypothetical protein
MSHIYLCFSESDTQTAQSFIVLLQNQKHVVDSYQSLTADPNSEELRQLLQNEAEGYLVLATPRTVWEDRLLSEVAYAKKAAGENPKKFLLVIMLGLVVLPQELLGLESRRVPEGADAQMIFGLLDDYLSTQNAVSLQPAYWLLKINEATWGITAMQAGGQYTFESFYHLNQAMSDYADFGRVREGDLLLGYAYGATVNAVIVTFRVTKRLYTDPDNKERIDFTLESFVRPPIGFAEFADQTFSAKLDVSTNEKLFLLDPGFASDLLAAHQLSATASADEIIYQASTLTIISNDVPTAKIKDQLGFEADYEALAGLIAYEKVDPPLAIGLFGNWGSGKSFFMQKLEDSIRVLSKKPSFCKEVVHIRFNSWHYSDTNLWASLITRIFDGLNEHKKKEPDQLALLYSNLNATKELLEAHSIKEKQAMDELSLLKAREATLNADIAKKTAKLRSFDTMRFLKAIFADERVKEDLDDIKKKFGLDEITGIKELQDKIEEVDNFGVQIQGVLKQAYSFRNARGPAAIAIVVVIAVLGYFATKIPNLHIGKGISILIGGAVTVISQLTLFIPKGVKYMNQLSSRLKSLKKTMGDMEEEEKEKFRAEQQALRQEILDKQAAQTAVVEEQKQLEVKLSDLKAELNDIRTGKKIASFIENRVNDERYLNSLGIISWVRKDFEQLNFLLKQQNESLANEEDKKNKVEGLFEVNRIVLYIDDLDRCEDTIVVNVLEALHLLMAFSLFVVVVGVDPRWMNKALTKRFDKLLDGASRRGQQSGITSQAYLEKIFQIPFLIKPINPNSVSKLIGAEFEPAAQPAGTQAPDTKQADRQGTAAGAGASDPGQSTGQVNTGEGTNTTNGTEGTTGSATDNQTQNEAASVQAALLVISKEEIELMQALGPMIGTLPRTIKRYINIYRIIRSHRGMCFGNRDLLDYYFTVMLMLALVTGQEDSGYDLLALMGSADGKINLGDFLKNNTKKEEQQALLFVQGFFKQNKQLEGYLQLPLSCFQQNIELVSRFSFHLPAPPEQQVQEVTVNAPSKTRNK